jgi:hypothetical protein
MMGRALGAWIAISCSASAFAAPPALEKALGEKRVVVVLGEAKSEDFKKQAAALKKGAAQLKERDVAIFQEGDVKGPLHQNYDQGKGFLVMIFGKDRDEKLRALKPITVKTITGLIDAMPMRKQEVKGSR